MSETTRALAVIALDRRTRNAMHRVDRKAWHQMMDALRHEAPEVYRQAMADIDAELDEGLVMMRALVEPVAEIKVGK